MNRYMNKLASSVIQDADVVVFMIDATQWREDDEAILEKLYLTDRPVILAINKIDKLDDKKLILPLIEDLKAKYRFAHIIPLSARKLENVEALEDTIADLMPAGPHHFPDDQITDKNEIFQTAEIIREKLIRTTQQEIPYSTTVLIDDFKREEKLIRIDAIIWVEREGQKAIVIGKNGDLLKKNRHRCA